MSELPEVTQPVCQHSNPGLTQHPILFPRGEGLCRLSLAFGMESPQPAAEIPVSVGLTELVLEAQFGQEDQDEGQAFLEPADHGLQLGQGRGGSARVLVTRLICVRPVVPAHVLQQRAPTVSSVVKVVVGLAVVVGAALAPASSLLSGCWHLDEHVPTAGRGPQHQAGWERGGGKAACREAGEAREERWRGGGFCLQTFKDAPFIHAHLGAECLAAISRPEGKRKPHQVRQVERQSPRGDWGTKNSIDNVLYQKQYQ